MNSFWKRFALFTTLPILLGILIGMIVIKYSTETIKQPLLEELQQKTCIIEQKKDELEQARRTQRAVTHLQRFEVDGKQIVAAMANDLKEPRITKETAQEIFLQSTAVLYNKYPTGDTLFRPVKESLRTFYLGQLSSLATYVDDEVKSPLVLPNSGAASEIRVLELELERRIEENRRQYDRVRELDDALEQCLEREPLPPSNKGNLDKQGATEGEEATVKLDDKIQQIGEKIVFLQDFVADLEAIHSLNGWLMDGKTKSKVNELIAKWKEVKAALEAQRQALLNKLENS